MNYIKRGGYYPPTMQVGDVRQRVASASARDLFGVLVILAVGLLALDLVYAMWTGTLRPGLLATLIWNGIIDSLYIALAAVGLSMTYSILRFANFSHGDLLTAGAFSGWTVAYVIGGIGLAEFGSRIMLRADGGAPPGQMQMTILQQPLAIVLGLVLAVVATILIALLIDRLVYKRMRDVGGIPLLIASVGVALALRYVIALFYTTSSRGVVATAPTWELPLERTANLHELTLVVIAVALIVGLHLLLQYTKLGKSMRAMSDNKDLALVTGIPTERVITLTWVIGAGLAGAAGYLIVLDRGTLGINLGWFLLLLIFAAVIMGGIGSIYGALLGSLVIGLTINVSLIWIPGDLNEVAAFALMILVLIFRPEGILGGVETA